MWIGHKVKITVHQNRFQQIEYLTQINSSPTDPAVVKQTMRRSLQIAAECDKTYFNVTYNFSMSKITLGIHSAESEFKSIFINFRPFHIFMSFYKAIGKFINRTDLINMLIYNGILAHSSVN